MQKYYLILPVILSLFSLLSAGPPDTLWTREYKGGNYSSGASSVQQVNDSGFIVCGSADQDVYLIRTNQNGDTLWARKYGGDSTEYGGTLDQTIDGGFVVTGGTESYGGGGRDIYLLRLNSGGGILYGRKRTVE